MPPAAIPSPAPRDPAEMRLFGPPQAEFGATSVRFPRERPYQLLAYLACRGDWAGRDQLAHLFWPERPQRAARRNLRKLLHRIRRFDWLRGFESSGRGERWLVTTDLAAFQRAVAAGDWRAAIDVYRGPLLEGMEGAGAEYDLWLAVERERLDDLWRDALLKQADALERQGRPAEAARLLAARLAHDALDEAAVHAYMRAALAAGDRGSALKAYRAFGATLREQLDLEPTAPLRRLAGAVEAEDAALLRELLGPDRGVAAAPPPAALPRVATSFVGRAAERAEVARLLARPECRLLTITGPGGVGKSRLALETVRELAPGVGGEVRFVPLEAVADPALLPVRIAAALGLDLDGDDAAGRLARAIGERRLLLVLDNVEQLATGAPLVAELLRACPGLTLLATSRDRFDLREEWLLPLGGLPFPPAAAELPAPERADAWDAIRLFRERAAQVQPGFAIDAGTLPAVLAVCRLLDGSPLALELAAAWVRILPCREIAAEIARDLDFLATDSRAVPERHRSLRATFEHSWRLLAPAERDALRRLAVFAGGFGREAAAHVAGAPLPVLASLVDRALLRVASSGRYDRHPLVHQYSAEKLAARPDELAAAREAHARYYAELVSRPDLAVQRDRHDPGRRYLAAEYDNLRAMWAWGIERGDERLIGKALRGMASDLAMRGLRDEAIERLDEAVEAFPDATWIRRVARNRQAAFDLTLSRWRRARERLEEARALAGGPDDRLEEAITLMQLGRVADMTGDYAAARRLWEMCRGVFLELDRPIAISEITHALGLVAHHRGAWREAIRLQRDSLALKERIGYAPGIAVGQLLLGDVHLDLGDLEAARACYRESLRIYRELDDEHSAAGARLGLALVAVRDGDPAAAGDELAACLALFERRADRIQQVRTLLALGEMEAALARPSRAREHCLEALERARRTELEPLVLLALVRLLPLSGLAEARRRELLRWTGRRAACSGGLRRELEELLGEAPEPAPAAAGESPVPTLEGVVAEVEAAAAADAPPG